MSSETRESEATTAGAEMVEHPHPQLAANARSVERVDVDQAAAAEGDQAGGRDRGVSVVDTKPPVEFLTIRNLDTGEAFIIGENDPDFDFNTFALTIDGGEDPNAPKASSAADGAAAGGGTPGKGGRGNEGWWTRMRQWIYKNKAGSAGAAGGATGGSAAGHGGHKPKTPFTKLSSFKFHRELGKGAFGRVLLAEAKIDGKLYALKIISKKDMRSSDKRQAKAERDILLSMSHTHSHPFTTGLKFAFQSTHNLYLGMDYFPGGTLKELIKKYGFLSEDWVRLYSAELVLAISHLHSLHVIYRDIKPHNIMIDAHGHIILIDYGLSKQEVSHPRGAQSLVGTPDYSAPEVLKTGVYRIEQSNKEKEKAKADKAAGRGKATPAKDKEATPAAGAASPGSAAVDENVDIGYGKAADWWSLGVMMYEMLSGTPAFRGKDLRQTYQRVLFAELVFEPEMRFSADAKAILTGLLQRDPAKRLGAGENPPTDIMSMPFFAGVDWVSVFERQNDGPVVPNPPVLTNKPEGGGRGYRGRHAEDSINHNNPKLNLRDSIISPGGLMGNDPNALQDWSFFDENTLGKAAAPTNMPAGAAAGASASASASAAGGPPTVAGAAGTPLSTLNEAGCAGASVASSVAVTAAAAPAAAPPAAAVASSGVGTPPRPPAAPAPAPAPKNEAAAAAEPTAGPAVADKPTVGVVASYEV